MVPFDGQDGDVRRGCPPPVQEYPRPPAIQCLSRGVAFYEDVIFFLVCIAGMGEAMGQGAIVCQ